MIQGTGSWRSTNPSPAPRKHIVRWGRMTYKQMIARLGGRKRAQGIGEHRAEVMNPALA